MANIEALSSGLSERHREILVEGRFRIGAAQKALNLYLKYAWARGIILEPPHCPIDSIVLKKIEKCPKSARCQICPNTTWTTIRTTQEYLHFVEKAREAANAQGKSLARWGVRCLAGGHRARSLTRVYRIDIPLGARVPVPRRGLPRRRPTSDNGRLSEAIRC